MLKKTDVYDFIVKVQAKAIKALKEKYAIELAQAIETALNEPQNHVLRDAITQIETSTAMGIEARNIVRKQIPRCDRWNSYFHAKDVKNDLFADDYHFPKGFDSIRSVHADCQEKIRKVEDEYAKIRRICQNKKTGEQGKTALIALGFDVTYLDNLSNLPVVINPATMDIDKSLIFVCGETGV